MVCLSNEELDVLETIRLIQEQVENERKLVDKSTFDKKAEALFEKQLLEEIRLRRKEKYEQSARELLKGKRIILYSNEKQAYDKLEEFAKKYQILSIEQKSALEVPKYKKDCDYIIFSTKSATHSVKNKLVSLYGEKIIYYTSAQEQVRAMQDFLTQLMGYGFED